MAEVKDSTVTIGGMTADDSTDENPTPGLTEYGLSSDGPPEPSPNGLSTTRNPEPETLPQQTSATEKDKDGRLDAETLLLASTLVLDAKGGRTLEYIPGYKYVRSYQLYNRWYLRWLLYLCIAVDLALALFEKPALPDISAPYWGTMIVEAFCLSYFMFRLLHAFYVQYSKVFIRDPKNLLVLAVIILTLVDMLCYILWINIAPDTHPVRWSRSLRPLFMVYFPDSKQIRRAFRNIRRTIPEIMNVLALFALSVLMFSLIALKLFYKRGIQYPNGEPYFTNYLDGVWDLYVMVTTSNSPDVMMPAYDRSTWFAIFFVVYLVVCLYIFMSIVLATIYNNYKKNLKNEVKEAVFLKRKKLASAFELLKVQVGNEQVITHACWKDLMSIILPNRSAAYIDLLMKILDSGNKNVLGKRDFLNLSDLLNVKLSEVKDRRTLLAKYFPNIYNHKLSEHFKFGVRHKYFTYLFDLLILVNMVFIAVDLDNADWFFLSMFTVEIVSKFYVLGGIQYFQHFWNVFDLLVIGAVFVVSIIEAGIGETTEELSLLDLLLVLRVMRLIRIFSRIKRFKVVLQTLNNIGPSIATYGGVMFVFYYFFSIIGMEVFSGYISYYGYDTSQNGTNQNETSHLFCGNVLLNNSDFYKLRYCKNNFNNIIQAMVVMFELTVVNQWHAIVSGFVLVTNKAARIYFFAFHYCCVVIVLNIFIAFILEAFILEFNLQTVPKLETAVEKKIKELGLGIGMKTKSRHIQGPSGDKIELIDEEVIPEDENEGGDTLDLGAYGFPDISKEKGLKFHLKKQSHKKVEVLLQQMFQGELGDIDEGQFDAEMINSYQQTRRLTIEELT